MAIYFARASFCSRTSGKGVVAQAAYRSGKSFKDNQRGRTFDYSQKTEGHEIHQRVLLPEGAPEWMEDSEKLWNHVQEFETNLIFDRYKGTHNDPIKREKSLAGREKALNSAQDSWNQIIALPRELDEAQNIEMLESYLQKRFVSRGLVCDYSIHKDKGNWHAHVAVALREMGPNGELSEKKITSYKGEDAYKDPFCRQQYPETKRILAESMNCSLERAGSLERVDHRTLEEQGIKRQSMVHEGSYARLLEKSGEKSRLCQENRDRKAQNIALYLENPAYLLYEVARKSVVFTETKIAETIFELVDGDEHLYQDLSIKVKAVPIPESARQAVKGGFQYKSDELIEHFDVVFAEQERSLSVEVTDLVKAGEGNVYTYLEKESALVEFKKIGLSNHLIKTTGRERDDLLAGFVANPASLVDVLAKEKIVFREKDIENTLYGLVSESEACYRILESYGEGRAYPKDIEIANQTVNFDHDDVKADVEYWIQGLTKDVVSSSNSIDLGQDVGREKVFTSTTQQEKEGQTLGRVQRLSQNQKAFKVKESRATKVINDFEAQEQKSLAAKAPEAIFEYSDEQREAIDDLLSAGSLKILKGRAGTGKSTVLKPIVAVLKDQGYDFIGMASYGKVSEAMEGDLGINARTIDSLKNTWNTYDNSKEILSSGRYLRDKDRNKHLKIVQNLEKYQITANRAAILDEGSLVSHEHYDLILSKVEKAGSKLIIVKDDSQIKTLFGADISEAMDRFVEGKSLVQVQRQKLPWMKEASIALNSHKIEEGLLAYEEHGCIKYLETHEEAKAAFVESYVRDFDPSKTLLGMTFLNKDVRDLNLGIFESLREKGRLGETFVLKNTPLAVGATVAFSKNDKYVKTIEANGSKSQGVNNGSFGVIESYNNKTHEIKVRLATDGRLVTLNAKKGYNDLTLGYVITSTKAQCLTFDGSKLLCSKHDNAGSTVVNCTRHKDSLEIFSAGEVASDVRGLAKAIGTSSYRGTTLDYSVNEEERPFLEKVSLYKEARIEFAQSLEKLTAYKDDYQNFLAGGGTPQEEEHKAALDVFNRESYDIKERRNALAGDILENWHECSTFCRQSSINEETLSKESGKTQGLFTTLEHKRFEKIEQYIDVAQETRRLWEVVSTDTPSSLIHDHPLYNEYQQTKSTRDHLAIDMALAPKSYKNLFVTSSFYGEGTEPIGYTLLNGKSYESRPPSFESCLHHAKGAEPDSLVFEANEAGKIQSHLYETLKEYKVLKSRSSQAYHNLQDDLFKTDSVVKELNAVMASTAKDRDAKAALGLSLMDQLSYSQSAPVLAHLGFDEKAERVFYEHIALEEMRTLLAEHGKAASISERLSLSTQLHDKLFPEGVCDKKVFAQFKGMGGDPQRLMFEQGYAKHLDSGAEALYSSPSDLEDAYHCLSNYKKSHAKSVKNWQIIKGDIKTRVETLHMTQIESLNEAGHFLSYEELKAEAFEALKFNVGNENNPNWKVNDEKVLSYVSGELKRAISSVTIPKGSDSAIDVRSQHRQLQIMQTALDGGRRELANYHEVMTDSQVSKDYTFAENAKKMWARDLVENKSLSIVENGFGKGLSRQVGKDAMDHNGKVLVKAFQQSFGLEKGVFARQILEGLEEQKETNSFILRNHLRQAGIYPNNMDLQLYALLEKASVTPEEKAELSKVVYEYVQQKTRNHDLRFDGLEKAKTKVVDVSQGYTSGLLALKDQFETMSPHKRLRYDGENLVKFVLSTAKEAGISVEDQLKAQDHSAIDILRGRSHKVYRSIRETVFEEVARINDEKHWGLKGEQWSSLIDSLMNVAIEKQALDREIYGAQERNPERAKDLRALSASLMASPLGDSLKDRDEKWAKAIVDESKAYEVSKAQEVDTRKDVGDHGQALGLQHKLYKPDEELKVNMVEVEKNRARKENVSQPRQDNTIGSSNRSERTVTTSDKGLSQAEFDKFIDDVQNSLRLEELAKDLLRSHGHNEKSSNSSRIAFTDKGSLVVNLNGEREGSWYDFRSQKGGSMFDLIQQEKGLDFKGALSYMSPYCRGSVSQEIESFLRGEKGREVSPAERQAQQEEHKAFERQREIDRQKVIDQKISDVHDLLEKTEPLEGTPAETYLRNERAIKGELPLSLRYIPAGTEFTYNNEEKKVYGGALASIAQDSEGCVKAVQVTYLTEEGTRALNKEGEKQTKISYGIIKGSFVDLTPPSERVTNESPLLLAEGVESALSVKESGIKGEVYCSLGTSNINNLDVTGRDVIIAGDWDGSKDKPSWKITEEAKKSLEEKGNSVSVIYPVEKEKLTEELTPEKVDFNDLLKTRGVESIVARVSEQVPVEMASQLSHRENKQEKNHEQTQDIFANKATTDIPQHDPSTSFSQDKEKPLEKMGKEAVSREIEGRAPFKSDPYGGLSVFEYMKKKMAENPVQKKESVVKNDPYGGLSVFEYVKKVEAENPVQKKESVVKNDPYGGLSVFDYVKKVEAENPARKKESSLDKNIKNDPYGGLTVFEYMKEQMNENPNQQKEPFVEKEKSANELFREAFNIKTPEKTQETSKSASSEKERSRADDGWGIER